MNLTPAANLRVFFVHSMMPACGPQPAGLTPRIGSDYYFPFAFIQDAHPGSAAYIATHELGHALASLADVGKNNIPGTNERLMWKEARTNDPCRLIRKEWRQVNFNAMQLP
jgi:hypothetical protein